MKKKDLKNIVSDVVKEMSGTGGGPTAGASFSAGTGEQYATPKAFKKKVKEDKKDVEPKLAAGKVKDNYAVSHFGFKPAPHIPNRPSKAIDYKQLFEGVERDQKVKIVKGPYAGRTATVHDFDSEKDLASGEDWVSIIIDAPTSPLVTVKALELKPLEQANIEETFSKEDYEKVAEILDGIKHVNSKVYNTILNMISDIYPHSYKEVEALLSENYSKFRTETGKRTAPEQLHKAVKAVKKKLEEVNKLLEYTQQLKSEISESTEDFKYMKHTERALEQITEMIKHTYIKSKKLK